MARWKRGAEKKRIPYKRGREKERFAYVWLSEESGTDRIPLPLIEEVPALHTTHPIDQGHISSHKNYSVSLLSLTNPHYLLTSLTLLSSSILACAFAGEQLDHVLDFTSQKELSANLAPWV